MPNENRYIKGMISREKNATIYGLQKYIAKIESEKLNNGEINFAAGFTLFKKSRATNRNANYLLAKDLLSHLSNNGDDFDKTAQSFENTLEKRRDLASSLFKFFKRDRGINSDTLNHIIERGKSTYKI